MQVKKSMLRVGAMTTWLPVAPQCLDRMDMHLPGDS